MAIEYLTTLPAPWLPTTFTIDKGKGEFLAESGHVRRWKKFREDRTMVRIEFPLKAEEAGPWWDFISAFAYEKEGISIVGIGDLRFVRQPILTPKTTLAGREFIARVDAEMIGSSQSAQILLDAGHSFGEIFLPDTNGEIIGTFDNTVYRNEVFYRVQPSIHRALIRVQFSYDGGITFTAQTAIHIHRDGGTNNGKQHHASGGESTFLLGDDVFGENNFTNSAATGTIRVNRRNGLYSFFDMLAHMNSNGDNTAGGLRTDNDGRAETTTFPTHFKISFATGIINSGGYAMLTTQPEFSVVQNNFPVGPILPLSEKSLTGVTEIISDAVANNYPLWRIMVEVDGNTLNGNDLLFDFSDDGITWATNEYDTRLSVSKDFDGNDWIPPTAGNDTLTTLRAKASAYATAALTVANPVTWGLSNETNNSLHAEIHYFSPSQTGNKHGLIRSRYQISEDAAPAAHRLGVTFGSFRDRQAKAMKYVRIRLSDGSAFNARLRVEALDPNAIDGQAIVNSHGTGLAANTAVIVIPGTDVNYSDFFIEYRGMSDGLFIPRMRLSNNSGSAYHQMYSFMVGQWAGFGGWHSDTGSTRIRRQWQKFVVPGTVDFDDGIMVCHLRYWNTGTGLRPTYAMNLGFHDATEDGGSGNQNWGWIVGAANINVVQAGLIQSPPPFDRMELSLSDGDGDGPGNADGTFDYSVLMTSLHAVDQMIGA